MEIFLLILLMLAIVIVVGIVAVYYVGLWKVFKKAGKNGWEAIIPFYNTWVLAEISGTAWWYALIVILSSLGAFSDSALGTLLSLASYVASFFIYFNLSKKFNKDVGIAILLTLFPFVMICIMAFSDDFQYDKDVVVSENGPINSGGNNTSNNSAIEKEFCPYCGNEVIKGVKYCSGCGKEIH